MKSGKSARDWPSKHSMANFEKLMTEQIPRLRRYARALVHDVHRADDLVQDCLERAWNKQHLWDSAQPIRPWMFTIMHNIYANAARSYNRGPQVVPLEETTELQSGDNQDGQLAIRDLERALPLLEDNAREVILLVGLEQLSYKEVAAVLNLPIGTVMSRLSRARERLTDIMQHQFNSHIRRVK